MQYHKCKVWAIMEPTMEKASGTEFSHIAINSEIIITEMLSAIVMPSDTLN